MAQQFFPQRPDVNLTIYAYEDTNPQYSGMLKVGETKKTVQVRTKQQYPTERPKGTTPYIIRFEESAMRSDGTSFRDYDVHRVLKSMGVEWCGGEWFRCGVKEVKAAVRALRERRVVNLNRTETFSMRPEQAKAVEKTSHYFRAYQAENNGRTPHFLWNCKMRFGKTFAAYQLAKTMGWKRLLVLTFKPAVQSAWEDDLRTHIDFEGWQFISRTSELTYDTADHDKPIVCFGSFQDYLGKSKAGGIKAHNEWVHAINWDCVILDEYHYGAWRDNAKDLFENEDKREQAYATGEGLDYYDEGDMPITTGVYLYLSGTPFRAISSGEFIEEQIYNWTYSDEQRAKAEWNDADGENPYATLPRMVMMTYQLPDELQAVASQGEFNEFDLNIFFLAEGEGKDAHFIYEDEVQKWLDLIRGAYSENIVSDLKLGKRKAFLPFSFTPLLETLTHTLWLFHTIPQCYAMRNLLAKPQNRFYHDYKVVLVAGKEGGIGVKALQSVYQAMGNPMETKTITISCGKLTTGVSVKPWTGILMLRNCSSPESYFQAAFRVQTPWTIRNADGLSPNKVDILKEECYVFDFAPNRALRQISDYSCRLNVDENNPEKKVEEFINFLPVLAYDGSSMKQIDAAGILDIAMSGTSATLLARKWESAILVNVTNDILRRLMNNDEAMSALNSIVGFRNLNHDIETIINKSEKVQKMKKEIADDEMTKEKKRELTEEEKEYKSMRKQIQEKLIKFATRVPVFMYLTDYREHSLQDVITQLEPGLFKKVTGLSVKEFGLLVSLGVFNSSHMNDAIYKFKRYEDSSLNYIGIDRHGNNPVGGWDTVLSPDDYRQTFGYKSK